FVEAFLDRDRAIQIFLRRVVFTHGSPGCGADQIWARETWSDTQCLVEIFDRSGKIVLLVTGQAAIVVGIGGERIDDSDFFAGIVVEGVSETATRTVGVTEVRTEANRPGEFFDRAIEIATVYFLAGAVEMINSSF